MSANVTASSRERILDVALQIFRAKGYTATSVDDLCAAAHLTKGSFFHHFKSKEDLAIAAAGHWSNRTDAFFAAAPYQSLADPLQRLLAYVDFRGSLLKGQLPEFTCFAGTLVQEVFATHPLIRDACNRSISGHAAAVERDVGAAMRKYRVKGEWTAASLALHTQAVLQGAFILAKARDGTQVAAESVAHLRRYIAMLFKSSTSSRSPHAKRKKVRIDRKSASGAARTA